jgi:hypothetical protein
MNADVTPMNADTPYEGFGKTVPLNASDFFHEESAQGIGVTSAFTGVSKELRSDNSPCA